MSYHVSQTAQFKADFRTALYHLSITFGNPASAAALLDEFDKAAKTVAAFPFYMQPYPSAKARKEEYRCIDVKNYLAFYVIRGNTVEFRRFIPARANIPEWLNA